jgi:hypothetical protein
MQIWMLLISDFKYGADLKRTRVEIRGLFFYVKRDRKQLPLEYSLHNCPYNH